MFSDGYVIENVVEMVGIAVLELDPPPLRTKVETHVYLLCSF